MPDAYGTANIPLQRRTASRVPGRQHEVRDKAGRVNEARFNRSYLAQIETGTCHVSLKIIAKVATVLKNNLPSLGCYSAIPHLPRSQAVNLEDTSSESQLR
jgi:hypothetical protein